MQKLTAVQCRALEKNISYKNALFELAGKYRARQEAVSFFPSLLSALYIALVAPRMTDFTLQPDSIVQSCTIDKNIKEILRKYITQEDTAMIQYVAQNWKTDDICAAILFGLPSIEKIDFRTVASNSNLHRFVLEGLDLPSAETILEINSYASADLMDVFAVDNHVELTIQSTSQTVRDMATLRKSLIQFDASILDEDTDTETHRYDRTLCHPVLGTHVSSDDSRLTQQLCDAADYHGRSIRYEWVQAFQAIQSLKQEGIAISYFTKGALQGQREQALREYFVNNELVRAVIVLPKGILLGTAISPCLMILSEQSKGIQFIDASDLGQKRHRQVCLDDNDCAELKKRMQTDTTHSCFVPIETVKSREYALDPSKYLYRASFNYAQPLSTVLQAITRGAQISKKIWNTMISDKPTQKWFLNVRNIRKGYLSNTDDTDAVFFEFIPEQLRKHMIQDGMLIVTRRGMQNVTTAVARVADEEEIVACPNVYLLDLDKTKVNPYFLQAFFESPTGREALGTISNGNVITQADLTSLEIPVPPMEVQNQIAAEYIHLNDRACRLLDEFAITEKKISDVWRDEAE